MVLIVDSDPSCTAESSDDSCIQATRQLATLTTTTKNVTVVVVALVPDPGVPGPCLTKIALQAATKLWKVTAPADLDSALGSILSDAAKASCVIQLGTQVIPDSLKLYLDNVEVRRDLDGGWDVQQSGPFFKIVVKGNLCTQLQMLSDAQIEVDGCF
jgi:hypothetical protein